MTDAAPSSPPTTISGEELNAIEAWTAKRLDNDAARSNHSHCGCYSLPIASKPGADVADVLLRLVTALRAAQTENVELHAELMQGYERMEAQMTRFVRLRAENDSLRAALAEIVESDKWGNLRSDRFKAALLAARGALGDV